MKFKILLLLMVGIMPFYNIKAIDINSPEQVADTSVTDDQKTNQLCQNCYKQAKNCKMKKGKSEGLLICALFIGLFLIIFLDDKFRENDNKQEKDCGVKKEDLKES